MIQTVHASAIRFKGPGFYKTDVGHGPRYSVATPARTRMRQEIQDQHKIDQAIRDKEQAGRSGVI